MKRILFCALLALGLVSTAVAQEKSEPTKSKPKSQAAEQVGLSELRAETDALQLMLDLKLTVAQLTRLRQTAKKTVGTFRTTAPSRSSKEYIEKLSELRNALSDPQDPDGIEDLLDDLAEMAEEDTPELNHRFDLTKEARTEAKNVLKSLSPRQLAGYLSLVKDDLLDPREALVEAVASVRELKGDEWKRRREEIAEDIAGAAAGIDEPLEAKLNDRVLALLVKSHDLSDEEYRKQRESLEKEARDLFAHLTPIDVLRNEAEYAIAKLLSNPKLLDALHRRLKNENL
jgi:hypothetical protein